MKAIRPFVLFRLGCALAYGSADPERGGTVTGTVQDASGENPIANPRVTLGGSSLAAGGETWTGMAWDATTGTMYGDPTLPGEHSEDKGVAAKKGRKRGPFYPVLLERRAGLETKPRFSWFIGQRRVESRLATGLSGAKRFAGPRLVTSSTVNDARKTHEACQNTSDWRGDGGRDVSNVSTPGRQRAMVHGDHGPGSAQHQRCFR